MACVTWTRTRISGSCCGTVDQQLQEFRLAYDAIKSVDPSLKVMGPSLSAFADAPYPAGGYRNVNHDLDLSTFLDFAAAQGVVCETPEPGDVYVTHCPVEGTFVHAGVVVDFLYDKC